MRRYTIEAECNRCYETANADVGAGGGCSVIAHYGWVTITVRPFGAAMSHDDTQEYDLCERCWRELLTDNFPTRRTEANGDG